MFLWGPCTKIVQAVSIVWQKCFLGDPLPRLFKQLWFVKKKHGRQGAEFIFPIYLYRKLQKSSGHKTWNDFNIILQECFFSDSLPRLFKPPWFVASHGRWGWWGGGGVELIFIIYLYRKLQKSSCQKPLDRFQYNFAEMFTWWPATKIVQAVLIRQKTWSLGGRAYFPYISI